MKGKPCVITDSTEYLELGMTTVIANHCEITKLTKNMKFIWEHTKHLIIKLFLRI